MAGKPEVARRRFRKLSTLLTWTREAAPHKQIGFWDLLGNISRRYYPLGRALAAHEDVFLPGLHTSSTDSEAGWQHRLDQARAEAKQIAPWQTRVPVPVTSVPRPTGIRAVCASSAVVVRAPSLQQGHQCRRPVGRGPAR
ncbi:hypothetical protein GCM10010339_48550 [Streptomyces alanosinicus]|uniref:Uncharacterized protein n=1 Tax=Streptomyces alanosinicus TaxID=68171 RepID=A0A918YML6_9ACTN|nr:hypothetical protein GCM10010339_48550 [Streptomyces alanosinicus]